MMATMAENTTVHTAPLVMAFQVLGSDEAMETLDEGIVQNKHDGSEPPGPVGAPEEDLADVTDIFDFGMAQAELPEAG